MRSLRALPSAALSVPSLLSSLLVACGSAWSAPPTSPAPAIQPATAPANAPAGDATKHATLPSPDVAAAIAAANAQFERDAERTLILWLTQRQAVAKAETALANARTATADGKDSAANRALAKAEQRLADANARLAGVGRDVDQLALGAPLPSEPSALLTASEPVLVELRPTARMVLRVDDVIDGQAVRAHLEPAGLKPRQRDASPTAAPGGRTESHPTFRFEGWETKNAKVGEPIELSGLALVLPGDRRVVRGEPLVRDEAYVAASADRAKRFATLREEAIAREAARPAKPRPVF